MVYIPPTPLYNFFLKDSRVCFWACLRALAPVGTTACMWGWRTVYSSFLSSVIWVDYFFLYTGVFCLLVHLCTRYRQCPRRPEEGIRFPWTGVTTGCELPLFLWKSVLLNTEQCLQPGGKEKSFLRQDFTLYTSLVRNSLCSPDWLQLATLSSAGNTANWEGRTI